MLQFPSLPGGDEFQSTDVSSLWVFLIDFDVSQHSLDFLLVLRGCIFLGVLGQLLHSLLVGGLEALWNKIFWDYFGDSDTV
jgi:hypothetical protein